MYNLRFIVGVVVVGWRVYLVRERVFDNSFKIMRS